MMGTGVRALREMHPRANYSTPHHVWGGGEGSLNSTKGGGYAIGTPRLLSQPVLERPHSRLTQDGDAGGHACLVEIEIRIMMRRHNAALLVACA